jgi:GT2 family glycosyltransferase
MKLALTASLVIYNNDPGTLANTLKSFLNTTLSGHIILIDNSENPTVNDLISDRRCHYIFNNDNVGFGAAHNIGMKQVLEEAKYHVILNPDVTFEAGSLEKLYDYMERNPDIGLLLPSVSDFQGEPKFLCKRLPAPLDLVIRRFGSKFLQGIFEKRLTHYEMRDKDYSRPFEAPYLSGCFMFFRVEALKKVGLFDERFFMYMEDVDLSRRVHRHFKTVYYPEVHIHHGHARESYGFNRLLFAHIRSAVRYFNKWGWFFDAERKEVNRHL